MLPQDRGSELGQRLALLGGPLPPLRAVALLGQEVEVALDGAARDHGGFAARGGLRRGGAGAGAARLRLRF